MCITFVYQSLRRYTVLALDRQPIINTHLHLSHTCFNTVLVYLSFYVYLFVCGEPDNSTPKYAIIVSKNERESDLLPRSLTYEPRHEISNNLVCATSKASDQPAHTHSLMGVFACRLNILCVLSY